MTRKKKENDDSMGLFEKADEEDKKKAISNAIVLKDKKENKEISLVGIEKNLINIHYFGIATKKTGISRKKNQEVIRKKKYILCNNEKKEVNLTISSASEYGLPTITDLDYTLGFFKLLNQKYKETGNLDNPIAFKDVDIRKAAGKNKNARVIKEIRNWIDKMTYVRFKVNEKAIYSTKTKGFISGTWGIFTKSYKYRDEIEETGKLAEMNYIWLEPLFMANFINRFLRYVRHDIYLKLKVPLAKLLLSMFELLFYANDGKPITRNYEALCNEFDLQIYDNLSLTKQNLDPALNELKREAVLESWQYNCFSDRKKVESILFLPGSVYNKKWSNLTKKRKQEEEKKAAKVAAPKHEENAPVKQITKAIPEPKYSTSELTEISNWLKEKGVTNSQKIVDKSPHTLETMKLIMEDFNLKCEDQAKGNFEFKKGCQSWLVWAFSSSGYIPTDKLQKDINTRKELNILEKSILEIAEKIKAGEFEYFKPKAGQAYKIYSFNFDAPEISRWYFYYKKDENSLRIADSILVFLKSYCNTKFFD